MAAGVVLKKENGPTPLRTVRSQADRPSLLAETVGAVRGLVELQKMRRHVLAASAP